MVKRFVLLLAVLTLVAAACGDDDTVDETTATTAAVTTTAAPTGQATPGGTLASVIADGKLDCGVSTAAPAFTEFAPDGTVTGFDADFCRAVAAAIFGDANAVQFRGTTAAERFDVLKSGEVDVLFRTTTWTMSRDASGEAGVGGDFGPTTYFDGQQMMGKRDRGFTANSGFADIDGAIVCSISGTTTEKNITEGAAAAGVSITLEGVVDNPESMEKFAAGTCDIVTTDGSALVGSKAQLDEADEWVIFPPAPISKEPLGPMYRQNDSEWADVINWTVYATIIADEKGITSQNIDDMMDIDGEATRLFGGEGELQTSIGLPADAFLQVIKQVGNYDEIYTRNLNPVGLFREGSLNARFTEGGLQYAPPAR